MRSVPTKMAIPIPASFIEAASTLAVEIRRVIPRCYIAGNLLDEVNDLSDHRAPSTSARVTSAGKFSPSCFFNCLNARPSSFFAFRSCLVEARSLLLT